MILVAKIVGRSIRNSAQLLSWTYPKVSARIGIDMPYAINSVFVNLKTVAVFSLIDCLRFEEKNSSSHFFRLLGIRSLIFPIKLPLDAPTEAATPIAPTATLITAVEANAFSGGGTQTDSFEGVGRGDVDSEGESVGGCVGDED